MWCTRSSGAAGPVPGPVRTSHRQPQACSRLLTQGLLHLLDVLWMGARRPRPLRVAAGHCILTICLGTPGEGWGGF